MATWLEDVIKGLQNLNGVASLSDIYKEVRVLRATPHPNSFDAIIRRTIETYSSDSEAFNGKENIFYSADGLGSGVWGLHSYKQYSPVAVDAQIPVGIQETNRQSQEIYRILRDTNLARVLKNLHGHKCQVCNLRIELSKGKFYSEAHHIKPLGSPHFGPDIPENIIVLCPNHHVMLDYGAIELNLSNINLHAKHEIGLEFIEYHNKVVFNSVS
jgi:hypothetical protein